MARSLLKEGARVHCEVAVVSATSEVFPSALFQNAPARSARSEQGSSDNSFAGLVDSNTASASGDRFQDTSLPAPSRRV